MLAYKLDKQLNGKKILNDIQNLVNKYNSKIQEKILVIQIKDISMDSTAHIPKIEYKPS